MNDQTAIVPAEKTGLIIGPRIPELREIEALTAISKIAAYSGFLNSTSKEPTIRAADAFFVMMYGTEIGIPPMTALKTIYVIDGKPTCSAQAMLSLARKGGCEVRLPDVGKITDSATVEIRRPGGEWKSYTYTTSMAADAGLTGKKNWKNFPREMLLWRAVSTAIRFEASDFVSGLYTAEEINPDLTVDDEGSPIISMADPPHAQNGSSTPPATTGSATAPDDELDKFLLWSDQKANKDELTALLSQHGLTTADDYTRIIKALKLPESETWTKFSDAAEAKMAFEDVKTRIVELATRPAGPKGNPAGTKPADNPLKNTRPGPPAASASTKKMSDEEVQRLQDAIWIELDMPPADLYRKIGKTAEQLGTYSQAVKAIKTAVIQYRLPINTVTVTYYSSEKSDHVWGYFEAPRLDIRVRKYGMRTFLKEQLGEEFNANNGVDNWTPSPGGTPYEIDAVRVTYTVSQQMICEAETVTLVVKDEPEMPEDVEQAADAALDEIMEGSDG